MSFSSPFKCFWISNFFNPLCTHYISIPTYIPLQFISRGSNMHFHQFSELGWLRRVMFLVLLTLLFLVSGEKQESSVVGLRNHTPSMVETQKLRDKQPKQPLDVYYSVKRKVPNASDPLHNRWSLYSIYI